MHSATLQTPLSLDPKSATLIWHADESYGILAVGEQKFRIAVLHVKPAQLKLNAEECTFIAQRLVAIMNKHQAVNTDGLVDGGFTLHEKGLRTLKVLDKSHDVETKKHYDDIVVLLLGPRASLPVTTLPPLPAPKKIETEAVELKFDKVTT